MNMIKTIRLRCPHCGKQLLLMMIPNIESKRITCSSCGKNAMFREYEQVGSSVEEKRTVLPGSGSQGEVYLVDDATGRRYKLSVGANSVGRNASTCTADIKLETSDRSISRMHSYITVMLTAGGNVRCSISNAKNKYPTSVNGEEVVGDDIIVVGPGDTIALAGSKFHIDIEKQ